MDSPEAPHPAPEVTSPHDSTDRSDARRWRLLANRLLVFLGAALLAAALIFFFAYNWAELHRFGKFAVGFTAFLTAVGFAVCSPKRRNATTMAGAPVCEREHAPGMEAGTARHRAALFAAALCVGALLALIGQIYQTGADLWELFAIWAVLALPFALLSRGAETWLLWLGIANMALALWLEQSWLFIAQGDAVPRQLLCGSVFNAVCLVLAERFAHSPLFTPNRSLPRTAALLALGGLCTGACAGVFSDLYAHFIPLFIAGSVLALALYRHTRFDLVMIAIGGSSVIIFGTIALGKLANSIGGRHVWEFAAMSCSGFLIVTSGLFTAWLLQLHRAQKSPEALAASVSSDAATESASRTLAPHAPEVATRPLPSAQPSAIAPKTAPKAPVWINLLQGIAAWIAAGLLASSLAAPFWIFEGGLWVIALAFIGGALVLFYKVRGVVFFDQAALSLSLCGQCLFLIQAFDHWTQLGDNTALSLSLVVALGLFALRTPLLHRTLCLLWAAGCLYWIAKPSYETHVLFGIGFSTLTILLWLGRARWAAHKLAEYVLSLAHASSLVAWAFLGWNYFYYAIRFWGRPETPREFALLYSTASAAILVGIVAWLCRPLYATDATERAKKQATLLLCAAGLFAAIAYRDPALVLCTALLLATYAARQRAWFTAMLVALPLLIWQLYYSFEQTLLMRSLTLAGSGALLLALRQAIALITREETNKKTAPTPRAPFQFGPFQRGLSAATALGLALCLWGIWGNERTLSHGQPVLVELAPVDPRSLMQGDYMTLRYALDTQISDSLPSRYDDTAWRTAPRSHYAYLTLDEAGRVTSLHSTGPELAPLPEGSSLALKLRGQARRPSIGPNAFFFQEGHGAVYEAAKWAELRVDPSGKALLLNLRNEALEILGETKR